MRRHRNFVGPGGMSGTVALWGASSPISSIQRGIVTIANAASATTTITAVDLTRSVIRFIGCNNGGINQYDMIARLELTNSTTVTGYRFDTSANGTVVGFEVIEYLPGVIRSIQRGSASFVSATPKSVTLTAVDMGKTTVDFLNWRYNDSGAPSTTAFPKLILTSSTNLDGEVQSPVTQEFGYQVVEWY